MITTDLHMLPTEYTRVYTKARTGNWQWHYFANIPDRVRDAIVRHHLWPDNLVRIRLGMALRISSGYRPVEWEKFRERNGLSQHTFPKLRGIYYGATDAWADDPEKLGYLLVDSPYRRLIFYPQTNNKFFHRDYVTNQNPRYCVSTGGELEYFPNKYDWLKYISKNV